MNSWVKEDVYFTFVQILPKCPFIPILPQNHSVINILLVSGQERGHVQSIYSKALKMMTASVVNFIDQGYPGGEDMSNVQISRQGESGRGGKSAKQEEMRKQTFIMCLLGPGAVIRTLHMLPMVCQELSLWPLLGLAWVSGHKPKPGGQA